MQLFQIFFCVDQNHMTNSYGASISKHIHISSLKDFEHNQLSTLQADAQSIDLVFSQNWGKASVEKNKQNRKRLLQTKECICNTFVKSTSCFG